MVNAEALRQLDDRETRIHGFGMIAGALIAQRSCMLEVSDEVTIGSVVRQVIRSYQDIHDNYDVQRVVFDAVDGTNKLQGNVRSVAESVSKYADDHGKAGLIIVEGIDYSARPRQDGRRISEIVGKTMRRADDPMVCLVGFDGGRTYGQNIDLPSENDMFECIRTYAEITSDRKVYNFRSRRTALNQAA